MKCKYCKTLIATVKNKSGYGHLHTCEKNHYGLVGKVKPEDECCKLIKKHFDFEKWLKDINIGNDDDCFVVTYVDEFKKYFLIQNLQEICNADTLFELAEKYHKRECEL